MIFPPKITAKPLIETSAKTKSAEVSENGFAVILFGGSILFFQMSQSGSGAIAPKNSSVTGSASTGSAASLDTFAGRMNAFSIPDGECDTLESNFSPMGAGTLRMKRICAPKGLSAEQLSFEITCDMLAEGISFSMNPEVEDIESQCAGAGVRKIVNDYSVEISITLFLDRIIGNIPFMRMLYQTEKVLATTQSGGQNFELVGVSSDVLSRNLPRFALEFTPQEAASNDLTGTLIFPYAELALPSGELSFSKTDQRRLELMFNATLPPKTAEGVPKMVFGMWVPAGS